jgi:hypothetical protein
MTYSTSRDEPIFVPLHGKAVAAPLQHLQTQGGDVTLTAPEADSFTLASLEPTAKALDGAAPPPLHTALLPTVITYHCIRRGSRTTSSDGQKGDETTKQF